MFNEIHWKMGAHLMSVWKNTQVQYLSNASEILTFFSTPNP